MSGRKSRNKGNAEERAIVNLHREKGITAERTLESGARPDGSDTWDVNIYDRGASQSPLKGEVKCRESIGDWVWDYLGSADFLTLRKNRRSRLYVVTEDLWFKLIRRKK